MANILQVTTPNLNTDNRNIQSPTDPKHAADPTVRNPADPNRVVRADNRDGQQTGNTTQDDLLSVINYESNYGAFVKSLGENSDLATALESLLFGDMAGLLEAGQDVGALVDQFLMTLRMDSPQELFDFLQGQQDLQARFTGDFFNQLRYMLTQDTSASFKEAALAFLKGYNNYTSGEHLLQQLHSLMDDIEQLLQRSFREEFREMADAMNWEAANGDTKQNASLISGRMIPFLSKYISATHDYGPIRDATMLLIFNAVRYQDGEKGMLERLLERLADSRDFERMFKGDAQESFAKLLDGGPSTAQRAVMKDFADSLSGLLLKGANGQAGLENVQQFYTIMNGMLLNESVYMPLLHFIIPFQLEGNNVVSEMWVDPDARKDKEDGGRQVKLFLKFDVQGLGKFEMVMMLQDRESKMQLYVPSALRKQNKKIQTDVSEILKKNGLRLSQLSIYERIRDRRIDEVFPEIREKEKTINVRI